MAKAGKKSKRKKRSGPRPPEPAPARELRFKAPPELAERAEKLAEGVPSPELFRKLRADEAEWTKKQTELAEDRHLIDRLPRRPAKQSRKKGGRKLALIQAEAAKIWPPTGRPPEAMGNAEALHKLGKVLNDQSVIASPTTQLRALGRRTK